jgi:hypothetical protein
VLVALAVAFPLQSLALAVRAAQRALRVQLARSPQLALQWPQQRAAQQAMLSTALPT